ncbi:MAG: DUF2334 domain-containing protein [Treponema sp.]
MYLIRLDDASEYMDVVKWQRVIELINSFGVCPLIGIIPKCEDPDFVGKYEYNVGFWDIARSWQEKGYILALHGFNHITKHIKGGLNPIHNRSEFVSLTLEEQKKKIKEGYKIFQQQKIDAKVFFAPSHTFDQNTLQALKEETPIRIISDTIANNVYKMNDFFFLPCQQGKCRSLPFKFVTISLHPNIMEENDFVSLELFLKNNSCVKSFNDLPLLERSFSLYDRLLRFLYFSLHRIKRLLRR